MPGAIDGAGSERPPAQTFSWPATAERLRGLLSGDAPSLERDGARRFVGRDAAGAITVELWPPLVQPIDARSPREYLAALRPDLGTEAVVLLQAGAAALGLWRDDELLLHKAFKRYVVRGSGRAQPTHLRTKGKSRYGSRLRLQNARKLLVDVNERLCDWWQQAGPADRVFYSCPLRTWAELLRAEPAPPFEPDGPLIRIPMDVGVPDFAELKRVRRFLTRGKIVRHR